jgi:hypothetical protein
LLLLLLPNAHAHAPAGAPSCLLAAHALRVTLLLRSALRATSLPSLPAAMLQTVHFESTPLTTLGLLLCVRMYPLLLVTTCPSLPSMPLLPHVVPVPLSTP